MEGMSKAFPLERKLVETRWVKLGEVLRLLQKEYPDLCFSDSRGVLVDAELQRGMDGVGPWAESVLRLAFVLHTEEES